MESDDAETTELAATDPEMRQLLGLFDVPAFARRGQEMEFALEHLHVRLARERDAMLAMVRVRLRQWCVAMTSPDDGRELVGLPVAALIGAVMAEPPAWAALPAPRRQRLAVARDLLASVERFNRRWSRFLDELKLDPINALIDGYNRYYLLEKECAWGSSRLAARHFRPRRRLTPEALLEDHPLLPVT